MPTIVLFGAPSLVRHQVAVSCLTSAATTLRLLARRTDFTERRQRQRTVANWTTHRHRQTK